MAITHDSIVQTGYFLAGGLFEPSREEGVDKCGKRGPEQRARKTQCDRQVLSVGFADAGGMLGKKLVHSAASGGEGSWTSRDAFGSVSATVRKKFANLSPKLNIMRIPFYLFHHSWKL